MLNTSNIMAAFFGVFGEAKVGIRDFFLNLFSECRDSDPF